MATYNTLSVPHLYVPSLSLPKLNTPKLYIPRLTVPTVTTQAKIKRQHVNDLGDLILGMPGSGTLELQHTLEDYGFGEITHVPVLNSLVGAGLMVQERFIKPISEGNAGQALINGLETLGNSLDIIANPIKALLPVAGGGTYEDFLKSMGWDPNSYREIYQWDTGNFLFDLAGEIISDPINWFTLGGKALTKETVDATRDALVKVLVKEYGEEAVQSLSTKQIDDILIQLGKMTSDSNNDSVVRLFAELNKKQYSLAQELKSLPVNSEAYRVAKNNLDTLTKGLTLNDTNKLIDDLHRFRTDSLYKAYKSIRTPIDIADKLDKNLLRVSLWLTPFGPAWAAGKFTASKVFPNLFNKAFLKLKDYDLTGGINNNAAVVREINKYLEPTVKSAYREAFDALEPILKKYGITFERLQKMYMNILHNNPDVTLTDELFLESLYTKVPALKLISDESTNALLKNVKPKDLEDLLMAVKDVCATSESVTVYAKNIERTAATAKATKIINDLDIPQSLQTLDTQTKVIAAKENIKNIEPNIRGAFELIDNITNADNAIALKQTLSTLGITKDNIAVVDDLYKSYQLGNKKALDDLKSLLIKAKTKELVTSKEASYVLKGSNIGSKELKTLLSETEALIKNDETLDNLFDTLNVTEDEVRDAISNLDLELNNVSNTKASIEVWVTDYKVDLDKVYNTINNLTGANYAQYLKNVIDFKLDLNNMDVVQQYLTNIKVLKEQLVNIETAIRVRQVQGLIVDKRSIDTLIVNLKELSIRLNNIDVDADLARFLAAVSENKTYYFEILSAEGRFYLTQQALLHGLGSNQDWYLSLSETHGPLRNLLNNIMYRVDDLNQSTSDFVENLKQILLAIDSSNNLTIARKYTQDALDSLPLSKANKEYLVNNFINTLYRYGDEDAAQLLFNESNTLVESYMYDFISDIKPELDASVADIVQNQIQDTITNLFNNYLVDQVKIADNLKVVSNNVYHIITGETLDAMDRLGFYMNDVIEALLIPGVNISDVEFVIDTINKISTNTTPESLKQANKILRTYLQYTGDTDGFDRLVKKLNEKVIKDDALKEVLENVYRNIGNINEELAGYGAYLGTTATKYPNDKTLNSLLRFVSASKANEFVKNTTGANNMYAYMNANRFFGVRKVIDLPFRVEHRLTDEFLNVSTAQHYVLLRNLETAYYRMSKRVTQSTPEIELIRQALIKHYSNSAIAFGPKDATTYFLDATPVDILAWDMATSNKGLGAKESNAYLNLFRSFKNRTTIKNKLDRRAHDLYASLDSKLDKTLDIPMNEYTELINKIDNGSLDIVTDTFRKDINKLIKDATSLSVYQNDILAYIKNDGEAITNVTKLNKVVKDKRTVSKVLGDAFKSNEELLNKHGIYATTPMNSARISKFANLERESSLYNTIKSLNSDQLRTWVDRNVDGWFLVVDSDNVFETLHTPESLNKAGLIMQRLEDAEDIVFIRRVDNLVTHNNYEYVKLKYMFQDYQQQVTDVLKANRAYTDYGTIDVPDEIWDGHMMDEVVYNAISSHPSIDKALGNDVVRKAFQNLDENGLNNFYKKSTSRPNLLIVGEAGAYNRVLNLVKEQFSAQNIYPLYKKTDLIKNVYTGSLSSIKRVNKLHKYLQLFFNDDFYIGAQPFHKVLTEASDEELQQLFKRNNYVAAILKQNNKGEPVVYKIRINNQKMLQDAIKAKAIIVPNETYINMVLTINKQRLDSKMLNLYMRTIVGTYKTLYLHSIGFLFRNATDSLIYKNAAATDGLLGVMDNFKYEYRAMKMLQMYDDITKEALDIAKQNPNKKYNRHLINEVLSTKDLDTQSMYKLVDMFIDTGASGGYTKAFKDYLLTYNKELSGTNGFVWEQFWNDRMMNFPTVKVLNNANETIEQSARFGLFLKLIDEGDTYTDAIRKVIDTHFNYNLKEPGLELLEQIFWFSTFPINNMLFYMNEGLIRNPELLKVQMDALELSYNNNGYTWDDVRKSDYLTYNALAGNIRFYTKNNNKTILKLGSSVLDFFNVIANPLGEAKDRLNPFLSVLFGLEDVSQLNPLDTPIKRMKQILGGENYIPSVYTTLYDKYPPRTQIPRNYKKSYWRPNVRKRYFKRYNNEAVMRSMRIYTRRYNRRLNKHYWDVTTTPMDPGWYTHSARYKRTNRSINRKLRSYYKTR